MCPVDRYNPLKRSAISEKLSEAKGETSSRRAKIGEVTLESVKEDAVRYGLATDVLYQMNAGKEASIFVALWKEHPIILKAYRLYSSTHGPKARNRASAALQMAEPFATREYEILMHCFRAGVHVPTPIGRVANYLTMRFIGDGLNAAPQLKDVHLDNPEPVLDQVLEEFLLMYRDAHYVHGDLSPFNILWWNGLPWIIDVPQGEKVDTHCDMNRVEALLRRDITNVLTYFKPYGIDRDTEHVLGVFLSEYTPHNMQDYAELRAPSELVRQRTDWREFGR